MVNKHLFLAVLFIFSAHCAEKLTDVFIVNNTNDSLQLSADNNSHRSIQVPPQAFQHFQFAAIGHIIVSRTRIINVRVTGNNDRVIFSTRKREGKTRTEEYIETNRLPVPIQLLERCDIEIRETDVRLKVKPQYKRTEPYWGLPQLIA